MRNQTSLLQERARSEAGFSMVELLVAAAIFMVIGGATLALFAQHLPVFNQQQNLAEVNISLRNAVSQMQLDISNAGANYYQGINIPNYPVGVVVTNNPVGSGGDCRTGTPLVYGTNCFDSFSLITADSSTPPTTPSNGSGACAVTSGTTVYLAPPGTTGYTASASPLLTAAQVATAAASSFKNGDQILFVNSNGSQYTTAKLTANASAAVVGGNNFVMLTHGATTSTTVSGTTYTGYNSSSTNDPYGMTTTANPMLGEQYCPTPTDYVLRITPITYSVDTTDPNNPTLTRTIAGVVQTLSQKTLATQIVGFKVGASLFNSATDTDTTVYCFDTTKYDANCPTVAGTGAWSNNYTLVRSVMVSLVGRTKPVTDPTYKFRNSFDQGAYEIQGVSVVVNPRNMSMTD